MLWQGPIHGTAAWEESGEGESAERVMPFIILVGFALVLNSSPATATPLDALLRAAGLSAVSEPVNA